LEGSGDPGGLGKSKGKKNGPGNPKAITERRKLHNSKLRRVGAPLEEKEQDKRSF